MAKKSSEQRSHPGRWIRQTCGGLLNRVDSRLAGLKDAPANEPVPFFKVLDRELDVIGKKRAAGGIGGPKGERPGAAADLPEAERRALDANLTGLAFSGGGIRSATFNLGVIQALADLKLLRRIDYLSTVSGGGYIGSWLTALIDRENRKPGEPEKAHGVRRVEERLGTERNHDGKAEDEAVTWLREYSNYLTPQVGLLTADTWSTIAVYLRNLLLNLLVLVCGLAVLPLIPRIVAAVSEALLPNIGWYPLVSVLLGVGATCGMGYSFAALDESAAKINGRRNDDLRNHWRLQQSFVQWCLVVPLLVSAFLAGHWLPELLDGTLRETTPAELAAGTALCYGLSWLLAATIANGSRWGGPRARWAWRAGLVIGPLLLWALSTLAGIQVVAVVFGLLWLLLAAALRGSRTQQRWSWLIAAASASGAAAGLALWWLAGRLAEWHAGQALWKVYLWGTPLLLLWFILLGVLHTGLMGRRMLDRQREWLNRLGAWMWIYMLAWTAVFALVIHGPVLVFSLEGWWTAALATGWVASTLGGLLASKDAGAGNVGRGRRLLMTVAPYVFVAGLLMLLAVGLDWGLARFAETRSDQWAPFVAQVEEIHDKETKRRVLAKKLEAEGVHVEAPSPGWFAEIADAHRDLLDYTTHGRWRLLVCLAAGLLGVGIFLAWRIDVNEFSMHRYYRNRLVRAYLGASVDPGRRKRQRQPFTGFYHGDDILLGEAETREDPGLLVSEPGPLPIINTALNLVAGDDLAWQQRKAASFVLTPLYCGFDVWDRDHAPPGSRIEPHGYRPTGRPGSGAAAYGSKPVPLTLGSAFAISGAAASPNMGFRTTPAFAFLLTVFNVRLGWWLGNPRHRWMWVRSGPFVSMLQLFRELTGKTQGRTRYVYLSDGGHFENLGIYELVRRRCRFIVACDAGADPDLELDDLGNAIRKCRADFGIDVDLDLDSLRRDPESGFSAWHCAVGTIHYSKDRSDTERGVLLYVKASLTGDEPEDILNYARVNKSFPHQSTADQFFDESQFESYRRLGHHVATEVLARAVSRATSRAEEVDGEYRRSRFEPEKMWLALEQQWWPESRADEAFTRNTATLDALFERQRSTDGISFLDAQFYPEWPRFLHGEVLPEDLPTDTLWLPKKPTARREGFYFCNSLIQLMENVYIDLDLENQHSHPDNRGWMNLFKHWTWSGMFRVTWSISAATYGHRFQAFCNERLGLELGEVETAARIELKSPSSEEFDEKVAEKSRTFLNFLEREQISLFLRYSDAPVREVVQLELVQSGARGESLLRFGFGYVLLDEDGRVVLFRVQDHLRLMGLGREGLRCLLKDAAQAVPAGNTEAHLSRVIEAGDEENRAARHRFELEFKGGAKHLRALLESVRRELEDAQSER